MRFSLSILVFCLLSTTVLAQTHSFSRKELLPLCFEKLVKNEDNSDLTKHYACLKSRAPSLFYDAKVQALCMQLFDPKGNKERAAAAKKALKLAGSTLIEDEKFARAFRAFAFEAKMFDKLNVHNTEAVKYFACLQMSNNTKNCVKARREVEGAMEMYNLDFGRFPKAKTAQELYDILFKNKYLRKKMIAQCPEGKALSLKVEQDGYPTLFCPVHGTSSATINPKFPLSPAEFKMMEYSNVVIATQIELVQKRKGK